MNKTKQEQANLFETIANAIVIESFDLKAGLSDYVEDNKQLLIAVIEIYWNWLVNRVAPLATGENRLLLNMRQVQDLFDPYWARTSIMPIKRRELAEAFMKIVIAETTEFFVKEDTRNRPLELTQAHLMYLTNAVYGMVLMSDWVRLNRTNGTVNILHITTKAESLTNWAKSFASDGVEVAMEGYTAWEVDIVKSAVKMLRELAVPSVYKKLFSL